MLRAVLFDLDNTLIMKKPSTVERLMELGADEDAAMRAYAASEAWQGAQILHENRTGTRMDDAQYAEHVARCYAGALGGRMDAARDAVTARQPGSYACAPGTVETLRSVQKMRLSIGVASNNRAEIRGVLHELGLTPFFGSITISQEVGVLKPDPRILEIACARLGVACVEVIYVGDHPFDILCAHEAGMKIIWIPPNRHFTVPDGVSAPEWIARTIGEVPNLIRQMLT